MNISLNKASGRKTRGKGRRENPTQVKNRVKEVLENYSNGITLGEITRILVEKYAIKVENIRSYKNSINSALRHLMKDRIIVHIVSEGNKRNGFFKIKVQNYE